MNASSEHARETARPLPPAPAPVVAGPAASDSAVSWAAILAGATASAALSLVLLLLGTGLGLSSVSPWSFEGVSAETFGWSTILWISFTSLAAAGLGGYLAGRLRTKWVSVHHDETYFRDTAHGFLSWAVATLLTAALLTSAIGAILGAGAKAATSLAGTTAAAAGAGAAASVGSVGEDAEGTIDYFVDQLLRTPPGARTERTAPRPESDDGASWPAPSRPAAQTPASDEGAPQAEVARIFVNSLRSGELDQGDADYLGQVIAQRTGLSEQEARQRVNDVHARLQTTLEEAESSARELADEARKASAYAALWLFISLLAGAFFASLCATFGGRQRDL